MLILSRRPGEVIRIGEDVIVTILGIKNGQVRVGVSAPKRVPVHRQEVYERIHSDPSTRESAGAYA